MTKEQSAWRRFDGANSRLWAGPANSRLWSGPARLVVSLILSGLAIAWFVTGERTFLTVSIALIAVVAPLWLLADFRWATRSRSGKS